MKTHREPFFYIIAGPTGAGKTELAEKLAMSIGGEIVNADLGQFYAPLTIGTAKPAWKQSPIRQHLFDALEEPVNFSCAAYRTQADLVIKDITARGKIPIFVGGSGFYYQALLWDLGGETQKKKLPADYPVTWQQLNTIDPERAAAIHPRDTYRIVRALTLWHTHDGARKPSSFKPTYAPLGRFTVAHVTRDRAELYARIDARTHAMIHEGWVNEVRLLDDTWKEFLRRKKIIGYDAILEHLAGSLSYSDLVNGIQKSTRNYAKRQLTFFSGVKRRLLAADPSVSIQDVDLTLSPVDLYLNLLTNHL